MNKIILSLTLPLFLYAHTLPELFDALKEHSQTKSDEISVQKSAISQDAVYASLYPKINLFGTYDNYSTPTGMLPVPPNVLLPMIQDKSVNQPFSYNIYRAGASISMPIFVKSLFTMADKAEAMQQSAKAKKYINLLKNEAIIVGANANFLYLDALDKALDSKELSLMETQKTLQIKVENGRSPESALYKINDGLNQISIAKNNIDLQRKNVLSSIESLTGIVLQEPIKMQKKFNIQSGELASLRPLKEKIRADNLSLKAEKEKLYPALFAHGTYAYSKADAYNTGGDTHEEYGDVGLTLNIPLLAMDQYASISLAQLEVKSTEIELRKLSDELSSQAKMLEESLPLLENSLKLYNQSIGDKKKLLEIAKLNFTSGRLSTEEYLRYEDDVVSEEANLYKTEAAKWQTLMQLAVIYGNNIEEIVK